MAQYFRDFSEDTLGEEIPGFVREPPTSGANSNTDAVLVKRENAGAINGVGANLESAQTNRTTFRWTEVGPRTEGEIAGRILRTNTFDTEVVLGNINVNHRGEGIMFINRGSNFWITRFRASNATAVIRSNIAAAPLSINSSTWFYYRAQLIGGFARLKVWTGTAEAEPAEWLLDTAVDDSDGYFEPLDGRVCIGNFKVNRSCFWDFVSFGTDGDPAPLEPLADDEGLLRGSLAQTQSLSGDLAASGNLLLAGHAAQGHLLSGQLTTEDEPDLLFFDDFNRADEGVLEPPWLVAPSGPFTLFSLVNNAAQAISSFAYSGARLDMTELGRLELASVDVTGGTSKAVGFGFLDSDNEGPVIHASSTGTELEIFYDFLSGGSVTNVWSGTYPALPAGDFAYGVALDDLENPTAFVVIIVDSNAGFFLEVVPFEEGFGPPETTTYFLMMARLNTTRLDNLSVYGTPAEPVDEGLLGGELLQATDLRGQLLWLQSLSGSSLQGQELRGQLTTLTGLGLEGQLVQATDLRGNISRLQSLAGNLAQDAELRATLDTLAQIFLRGSLSQEAVLEGVLQRPLSLLGSIPQPTRLAGDLQFLLRLEGRLTQGVQLTGLLNVLEAEELAGQLEQAARLDGGLSGGVGVAGRLDQSVAVVGALARGLSVAGRTTQGASFIGALSGVQGLSGAIYQNALLAGTLAGSASILAGRVRQGQLLSGFLSVDTAISLVGQVSQASVLDGRLTGVANLGTRLEQDSRLEGWLELLANLEASLEQDSLLEGTIGGATLLAGLLVQSADLRAQLGADATVALLGRIQQASRLEGILQALQELEGRIEQGVDLRGQLEAAQELVARLEQEANFISSLGGLAELRTRLSQRFDLRSFLGRSRFLPPGRLRQRQRALALLVVQTLVEGSLRQRSRLVARLSVPSRTDTGYLTYSALYVENDLNTKVRMKKSLTYSSLSLVPALSAGRLFIAPESFKP